MDQSITPVAVIDAIQDGVLILDRDLTILQANRAIKQLLPTAGELVGNRCSRLLPIRSAACATDCPAARAIASGRREAGEIPFTGKDGESGLLESCATPLTDGDGRVTAVLVQMRDMTRSRQARALVQEREELYRSLFEKVNSIMLLVDPQTATIVDANPRACAFYGYDRERLITMAITDINCLPAGEVWGKIETARQEQGGHFTFRHRLADGTIRDVEVYAGPVRMGGRELLCSVIHDITTRLETERERERVIGELQRALSEVKTLRGLIPICASCKKIRDDKGYWNRIEEYLRDHSEAEFSHGICPECRVKLYDDLEEDEG